MSLRATQISLLTLNLLSNLSAVAVVLIAWTDQRLLSWLGFACLLGATLLSRLTPLLYMVGIVAGPGLLAFALSGNRLAGLTTSIVVTLAFYVFTWQARSHASE